MRRLVEPFLDNLDRLQRKPDVPGRLPGEAPENDGRLALAGRLLDVLDDMRIDKLAAVGDQRVEPRHLERGHCEVALPNRELDRVAGRPLLVPRTLEVPLVPRRRRHEARAFRADVDPGLTAETHPARPGLESGCPSAGRRSSPPGRSTCRTNWQAPSAATSARSRTDPSS